MLLSPVPGLAASVFIVFAAVLVPRATAAEVEQIVRQIVEARTIEAVEDLAEDLERAVLLEHLEPLAREIMRIDADFFVAEDLAREKGDALLRGLAAVPGHRVVAALEAVMKQAYPPLAREAVLLLLAREESGWVVTLFQLIHSPATATERRLALIDAFAEREARELLPELKLLFAGSAKDAVRAKVVNVLQRVRAPGLIALCKQAMGDGGDLTRKAALRALVRVSDQQGIDAFLALRVAGQVSCTDLTRILEGLQGLNRYSEAQRQLLLTMLEDDVCPEATVVTLGVLGEAREDRAAELAQAMADDTDRSALLNAAAVSTLLEIHADEDREALLDRYRKHPLALVRLVVAMKLLDLDRVEAVETLALFMESKDETLADPALAALMQNKFRETIPYLINSLRHRDPVRREEFGEALQEHMRCFFPYRTPSVKAFLLDQPAEREQAIRILLRWFKESS